MKNYKLIDVSCNPHFRGVENLINADSHHSLRTGLINCGDVAAFAKQFKAMQ